jgi:hypothetical protein
MDREAQINFFKSCQDRLRSYASGWLRDPAVRAAVHGVPPAPHGDSDGDQEKPPIRRTG